MQTDVHFRSKGGDLTKKFVTKAKRKPVTEKTDDIEGCYVLFPPADPGSLREHLVSQVVKALSGAPFVGCGLQREVYVMDYWESTDFIIVISFVAPLLASCILDLDQSFRVSFDTLRQACVDVADEYSHTDFKASPKELARGRVRVLGKLAPEAMDKVVKEGFERVSVSFVNVCGFGFIVSCGQKDSSMCKTPQVVSLRFTAETVQFLGYVVDANADLGMTVEYNATKEKKISLRLSRDNKSKSTTPVSLTETGRVHAEGNFGNVLEILRRFRRVIHICMNDEHRQKFMGSLSS